MPDPRAYERHAVSPVLRLGWLAAAVCVVPAVAGCAGHGGPGHATKPPAPRRTRPAPASLTGKWALADRLANTSDDTYYLRITPSGTIRAHGTIGNDLQEPYVTGCAGTVTGAPDTQGRRTLRIRCVEHNDAFPASGPRTYAVKAAVRRPDPTDGALCRFLKMPSDAGVLVVSRPDGGTDDLCRRG